MPKQQLTVSRGGLMRGLFWGTIFSIPLWAIIIIAVVFLVSSCRYRITSSGGEFSADELKRASIRMEDERGRLHTLDDVAALMAQFHYVPQYVYYEPNVTEVFAADLHGDCKAVAVLGVWALGVIGKPAHQWSLSGGGWGYSHRIAMSDDKTVFITNGGTGTARFVLVKQIVPTRWKPDVLNWFEPPYKEMKRVKR